MFAEKVKKQTASSIQLTLTNTIINNHLMVANMTKYFAAEELILAAGSSVIQESTNLTVNH